MLQLARGFFVADTIKALLLSEKRPVTGHYLFSILS